MNKIVAIVVLILCCWSVTGQIYHIGDLYTAPDGSQGIVFYVTPEGAGWVVLEEYEHEKSGGDIMYCEVWGGGASAYAHLF